MTEQTASKIGVFPLILAIAAAAAIAWIFHETFEGHVSSIAISRIVVPAEYDGCSDCSLIVRQMAWSMDHEPTVWITDGYNIWRSDACAWIANNDYGISIGPSCGRKGDLESRSSESKLIRRAYLRWVTNPARF